MKSLNKTDRAAYEAHQAKLADAIEALHNARDEFKEFVEPLVEKMTDYYDNKSDNWRDGDKGSEYDTWKGAWEQLQSDLEGIEIDEIEFPATNADEA